MKLGIFLLVLGLILAGAGAAVGMYIDPNISFWYGGSVQEARMMDAASLGVMVLGGGLALGGIIRMIVKR